jgi:hypothetical protein
MSVNLALAVGAVFVASMGTIAGACRRSETSATPNNIVRNNTAGAISSKSQAEASRGLGTALAAA